MMLKPLAETPQDTLSQISYPENDTLEDRLLKARNIAEALFAHIRTDGMIRPGVRESDLNEQVCAMAERLFGIRQYWHKRIVRAGENTLCPYRENPENRVLRQNEIVYFDFGPVVERMGMEADFARTYVLGDNADHHALLADLSATWNAACDYFLRTPDITGRELYRYVEALAVEKGYGLAEGHCGHLLGIFPHEKRLGDGPSAYICPENDLPLNRPGNNGEQCVWILEVHLTRTDLGFGGFAEDLLLPGIRLSA